MSNKEDALKEILADLGSAVVAYSGGVDSTYLAVLAHEVLGERSLSVTAVSPSLAEREREEAVELAQRFGLKHRLLETHEMDNPLYMANNASRCFFCKEELFIQLSQLASNEGYSWVIDGFNFDDLKDFRPGHKAGEKYGIRSPLFEAQLTKEEIRAYSHQRGLPTWDKPAMACLSSRIPYGTPVDIEVLKRIDAAETFLHDRGFRQLRVRHHDTIARIEVSPEDLLRLAEPQLRAAVVQKLRELGYLYVTLDLAGYRMGSLNEAVPVLARRANSP